MKVACARVPLNTAEDDFIFLQLWTQTAEDVIRYVGFSEGEVVNYIQLETLFFGGGGGVQTAK